MNFVQMLDTCSDIKDVLAIVKLVLNVIRWVVPVIIIVLTTLDAVKVVSAGNLDDKLKKEVGQKVTARVIYAVVIFLIPVLVRLIFSLLGNTNDAISQGQTLDGCGTWADMWG